MITMRLLSAALMIYIPKENQNNTVLYMRHMNTDTNTHGKKIMHRIVLNKKTHVIETTKIVDYNIMIPSPLIIYNPLLDQKISDYKTETRKAVENILNVTDI